MPTNVDIPQWSERILPTLLRFFCLEEEQEPVRRCRRLYLYGVRLPGFLFEVEDFCRMVWSALDRLSAEE